MTLEELTAKLKEHHADELGDVKEYCNLSKEMESIHPELAMILKDMSHEESTHAKMIEYMLGNM